MESELSRLDIYEPQEMQDSKKYGFNDRYYNTKIRLALTRLDASTPKYYYELKEGIKYFKENHGENHKMYQFGEFSRLYYDIVLKNHLDIIDKLTQIHDKMKLQQHNNYRKRNFAMATYYYWIGDIETGSRYLFSEIFMIRNLSQRATGFYYETMALYELRNNEPKRAIQSLQQALEVFESVESYTKIPKHNISVLETTSVEKIIVQFWKNTSFLPGIYYLDIRITW